MPFKRRCAGFDIDVSHAKILDVPVKLCLEFVTVIGSHCVDAKRKPLDNIVEKKNGIGLGVLLVNLEGADSSRIVNGCVLKTADSMAVFSLKIQELHIHLDVMARNLLLIAGGLHRAGFGILRQAVEPVTE